MDFAEITESEQALPNMAMASVPETDLNTSVDYTRISIGGTECFQMTFGNLPTDPVECEKEKQRRKTVKEGLGLSNLFTPMLDSRKCGNKQVFCDAIIVVKNINTWDRSLTAYYKQLGYEVSIGEVKGGVRRSIRKNDVPYLTITSYTKKHKAMIQPGNKCESNLIKWLSELPAINSGLKDTQHNRCERDSDDDLPAQLYVDMTKLSCKTDNATSASIDLGTACNIPPTTQSVSIAPTTATHLTPQVICKETQTSVTPPDSVPDGYVYALVPVPQFHSGLTYAKRSFIVNEILCYIQNKMDTLPTDTMVKLGSDVFEYSAIKAAKQLLYSSVKSSNRLREHRGNNKAKDDLLDIIKLLHSVNPVETPIFLACDISLLLPMTSDSNDMAAVFRNIESMKQDIKSLTDNQKSMSEIVSKDLQAALSSTRTSHLLKDNSPQHNSAQSITAPPHSSTPLHQPLVVQLPPLSDTTGNTTPDPDTHSCRSRSSNSSVAQALLHSNISSDTSDTESETDRSLNYADIVRAATPRYRSRRPSIAKNEQTAPANQRNNSNSTAEWQVYRTRHQHRQGSRDARSLRARDQHDINSNRTCTGIFLTRMHSSTHANSIALHIRRETGLKVNVEKLHTKHPSYSSFHIRCHQDTHKQLLGDDIWPKGSLVKEFMQ